MIKSVTAFFSRNRRRLLKQKRVSKNKIEKLLDVFPQVIFPKGMNLLQYSLFSIAKEMVALNL